MTDSWRMHASDHGGTFFNLGPRRYVELHGTSDPIVEVHVALVDADDPTATHWGWLAAAADKPSMIWPSWAQLDCCFTYGSAAEERAGKGRIVRLTVRAVEGDHRP